MAERRCRARRFVRVVEARSRVVLSLVVIVATVIVDRVMAVGVMIPVAVDVTVAESVMDSVGVVMRRRVWLGTSRRRLIRRRQCCQR